MIKNTKTPILPMCQKVFLYYKVFYGSRVEFLQNCLAFFSVSFTGKNSEPRGLRGNLNRKIQPKCFEKLQF
jgi:hypothetical protein